MKNKLFHVLVSERHAVTYQVRAATQDEATELYTENGKPIEDNIVGVDIIETTEVKL